MKDLVIGLSLLGMVSACSPAPQAKDNVEEDYCQYVNPFIGNADNGHTFPGACAPFGLIQASPESGVGSWRYCSGYNYEDNFIEGFAQTHLNGTAVAFYVCWSGRSRGSSLSNNKRVIKR